MVMIRLSADERREVILQAIDKLTRSIGVYNLTHDNVAEACSVPTSRHTVKHYFGTKHHLYEAAPELEEE